MTSKRSGTALTDIKYGGHSSMILEAYIIENVPLAGGGRGADSIPCEWFAGVVASIARGKYALRIFRSAVGTATMCAYWGMRACAEAR